MNSSFSQFHLLVCKHKISICLRLFLLSILFSWQICVSLCRYQIALIDLNPNKFLIPLYSSSPGVYCTGYSRPMLLSKNFRSSFSHFPENPLRIFKNQACNKAVDKFVENLNFVIVTFPICEYDIHFHYLNIL